MITAFLTSDDDVAEVEFDATEWFEAAEDEDIFTLYCEDFGMSYAADRVADELAGLFSEIQKLFDYVDLVQYFGKPTGFTCVVDAGSALRWIEENRPALYRRIQEEA